MNFRKANIDDMNKNGTNDLSELLTSARFDEAEILCKDMKVTSLAGPVLLALFLQAMYGAVDLMIVGKFASSADVSAVSTGSQIMMTITNLISSLCMGMTIMLGQKIGEKKLTRAEGLSEADSYYQVIL